MTTGTTSTAAGQFRKQPSGYRAFIPVRLPLPQPPDLGGALGLLSEADTALGRLDGVVNFIPNPDFFVAAYVRKEAVLSSQIEGTQASLNDVLEYEARLETGDAGVSDVDEVINYIDAMNYGIDRLDSLPLSLRLIREIHARLLDGVRGQKKSPGQFRTSQNWTGPANGGLDRAVFVPPPPGEVMALMGNLESFIRAHDDVPLLVRCAIVHAQFETIHPFLDGNGRVGRLLITFMLCERQVLRKPLLYLSIFLKEHRDEYYQRLMDVRLHGAWTAWIRFFLEGVRKVSRQAFDTARRIDMLRKDTEARVLEAMPNSQNAQPFVGFIFRSPVLNADSVASALAVTPPTAYALIENFERLGLLVETTGRMRGRRYRFAPYLSLLSD